MLLKKSEILHNRDYATIDLNACCNMHMGIKLNIGKMIETLRQDVGVY